jgi:hypothetical protein
VTIWQVAAGDGTRDYTDVFLDFGLACVGPGNGGAYPAHRDAYNDPENSQWRPFMQPFCEQVGVGDLLVLKRPAGRRWRILAVGKVAGPYVYREELGDVEGWDLQHTLPVTWHEPQGELVVTGLRRGTLARVNDATAREHALAVWDSGTPRPTQELPPPAKAMETDDVIALLMERGLPAAQAEATATTIRRLRRLAHWYRDHDDQVGEHEIRTFLIVPLLLALGWAEQRIKIELAHTDIALFDEPYSAGASPTVIVESKRLNDGLGAGTEAQVQRYARDFPNCRALVVSDGFRYRLLTGAGDGWKPTAYANLLNLRQRHPYRADIDGAGGLFVALLPWPAARG